ncbi:MAG: transglycosylase SLT domain-containing protein [Saprospiraceae bacterium]
MVALNLSATNKTTALPLSVSENDPLTRWNDHTETVIEERIERIALPFEAKYNAKVRTYLKDYLVTGYRQTEDILGRTVMYFPIFEHYLTIYKLPKELMYLAIVESALEPTAKSGAGAAGLWQLMPHTARQYGLRVDGAVDERLDPYRSTEAAVRLLADLYAEYRDWRLVMVAYNCGTGKLDQVMRSVRSKDYWELENYLPAQTRRYVPAYIAAAYIVHYQHHHELKPTYPALNLRETRVLKVYHSLSFQEIASACGIAPAIIQTLNPGYRLRSVPKSPKGQFLILPASAVSSFKEYLTGKSSAKKATVAPANKVKSSYVVAKGDRLETLATLFKCSVQDIMKWNGLTEPEVFVNQELIVYLPSGVLSKRA